jgi:hypothetical protein
VYQLKVEHVYLLLGWFGAAAAALGGYGQDFKVMLIVDAHRLPGHESLPFSARPDMLVSVACMPYD